MEARREVFVGRQHELDELEDALERTRSGSGHTVLVAGEAGIGKTRLVSEVARRARAEGVEVLVGRSIDLVGTELPYEPFAEALRPLGELRRIDGPAPVSQLRVFKDTLALLTERTGAAPVLLLLEDLHWADTSTLDLVVFLAHNLSDRRALLLATYRADDLGSATRMRRFGESVGRSGSATLLDLGPLEPDAVAALLEACADAPLPITLTDTITARSEGNPFFAQELLVAAEGADALPRGLRELLLQRVARLDPPAQSLLRIVAAAGRDIGYPLLRAVAARPEQEVRASLRDAVEHGVLVSEQATGSFRFRHALLAEAIYGTILPGEREEVHARLAEELARSDAAIPAELAPHWAAAGRSAEALAASIEAARESEAVFGLAEARAHYERAIALWDAVPDAPELAGLDLAELCTRTAELAGKTGAATRAVALARRAVELVGADDPYRAARLHVLLGEYLHETGSGSDLLAAFERAVELVPTEPPSPERAYALGSLAGAMMVAGRHAESLPIAEHALMLARAIDAREAEVRALTVIGGDLAYLGRGEEGVAHFRRALELAEHVGGIDLERAYVNFTDALTMLGRPRASVEVGRAGLEALHRHGIESTLLATNQVEALLAIGEWDEAERLSATALRRVTSSFPYVLLMFRAAVEIGRGQFDAARAHLDDAGATLPEDRAFGLFDAYLAELALWERRWTDAEAAIGAGLARARQPGTARTRVQLCAMGLRAQAELAVLARARRDDDGLRDRLGRAQTLVTAARRAAAEVSAITPDADGWRVLAEAEYARVRGEATPARWTVAAAAWDRLDRPAAGAYCRWRLAEALVSAGASRTEASVPLREAHAVAVRLTARPLAAELARLAERARLDLEPLEAGSSDEGQDLDKLLGLTAREAQVLKLLARGYTNREIAETLVISVKTAGVHVSHILRKLDAPNRFEAAAIAHRVLD
jgi:DNA-binding CsgD family transcriptional regulator/tetratricopeptide (TPR) repeat protein